MKTLSAATIGKNKQLAFIPYRGPFSASTSPMAMCLVHYKVTLCRPSLMYPSQCPGLQKQKEEDHDYHIIPTPPLQIMGQELTHPKTGKRKLYVLLSTLYICSKINITCSQKVNYSCFQTATVNIGKTVQQMPSVISRMILASSQNAPKDHEEVHAKPRALLTFNQTLNQFSSVNDSFSLEVFAGSSLIFHRVIYFAQERSVNVFLNIFP